MSILEHVFMAMYLLGALWIMICGFVAFFTRQSIFWIGDKIFHWSGHKALLGGLLSIIVGGGLFSYAAYHSTRGAYSDSVHRQQNSNNGVPDPTKYLREDARSG
jgi:hypothetical protein